ncbi:MAG: FAD binding domain-containing protein [Treponema sp.]|jgi:CO/xanthine dehydrogenase FAD-binding subunit|nr:FAD binding domain-containing protein [Treponema sp.]
MDGGYNGDAAQGGPHKQVFFPRTLPELFTVWKRFPDAVPYAGGTDLGKGQERKYSLELPAAILSLNFLEELHHFTRTERYIELGSMVKLNDILTMGKIVPHAFTQAVARIASVELRNLATLGGNICHPVKGPDASAALIALDARYELRSAQASRWISASRFASGPSAANPQELLVRIRIPLEQWDYTRYTRFEDRSLAYASGGSMVVLARSQKNILTDLRAVFAGESVLRDKNSETALAGKRLPLDRRDAAHFIDLWKTYLSAAEGPDPFLKARIVHGIEASIRELTD